MQRGLLMLMSFLPATTPEQFAKQAVFLALDIKPEVSRTCLSSLSTTLKAEIDNVPGAVLTKSRSNADIVVEVSQCVTSSAGDIGGEMGVSTSRGARQGSSVVLGLSGNRSQNTVARMRLVATRAGERKEFTPGSDALPLDDASRTTLRSLLTWAGLALKQDD